MYSYVDECFIYIFFQLKDVSTALQKTSQQVQKLVQMVSKPSPGASLLRSPGQPPTQSGEHTHALSVGTVACLLDTFTLYLCNKYFFI